MASVKANFHTHSLYSDGKAPLPDYVKEAEKQGLEYLGFSEHAPLPFPNTFAIHSERLNEYVNEVRNLPFPNVFAGLEMDYIPGFSQDFTGMKEQYRLDYIIGSVHLVLSPDQQGLWFIDGPSRDIYDSGLNEYFGGDSRMAVTAYYRQLQKMIREERFDVVGHLDKIKMHNQGRFFSEDEPWYRVLVQETLDEIERSGLLVEVNTRGIYKKRSETLFPGKEILQEINRRNIPVVLSSDAHEPAELTSCFDDSVLLLKSLGFDSMNYFSDGSWSSRPI